MRIIQPGAGKPLWAFFVASLVAATPALLAGTFAIYAYPFAFMITLGHALIVGAPLYFLLRRRFVIDWAAAMLGGALVGFVPVALFSLYAYQDALLNGVALVAWLEGGWAVFAFGAVMGLIAGTVFRAVLGPPQVEAEIDASIFE